MADLLDFLTVFCWSWELESPQIRDRWFNWQAWVGQGWSSSSSCAAQQRGAVQWAAVSQEGSAASGFVAWSVR